MKAAQDYKAHFNSLAAFVLGELRADEQAAITYAAESSYFMRFNNAKIRQLGTVEQSSMDVKLYRKSKTWVFSLNLSGCIEEDENRLAAAIGQARQTMPLLPDDPYQVIPSASDSSDLSYSGKMLAEAEIPTKVLGPADGLDFTGLYTQGIICRAAANSAGARHWFNTQTFQVDYSAWLANGKGVKSAYAGRDWNDREYTSKLAATRTALSKLTLPEITLKPGNYRAFVTADALNEVVAFFSWNGFGERGLQQGDSSYLALREGRSSFSEKFTLSQDFSLGVEPAFNSAGEIAPEKLTVVQKGKLVNSIVSSRTAKQYGVASNQAEEDESMRSVSIAAGELPEDTALEALGTGIYVSNFHYLNWSDTASARVTGMTRFGCLWVENGKIVGPIKDLRWDESMYNLLGSKLEAVTKERHLQIENTSYEQRAVGGSLLPAILVDGLSFTL